MNADESHSTRISTLLASLLGNRELIRQLTWQDIVGRYRGSMFGLAWSFLTPLFMLAVYTFVFSVVFASRILGAWLATVILSA